MYGLDMAEEKADVLRSAALTLYEAAPGEEEGGVSGMVIAASIQYLVMTEDGREMVGGCYVGGIMNALGLTQQANDELLASFYDDGEED